MQKCTFCGLELPLNSRFCGRCGHIQDTMTAISGATIWSNTPPAPAWPPFSGEQWPQSSQYPDKEDQEEQRRRAMLPDIPFPGVPMGSGQPIAPTVPSVQGTPQVSGAPMVQGTPYPAGGLPPAHPFSQWPASSAPSQAPSYPASPASFSQTGQQPPHTYHPQTPPHYDPPPPPHYMKPPTHETRHPHQHKMHHAAGTATKVVGSSAVKLVIIAVTAIVVLGAGGVGLAAYLLTRPQPVISVASDFKAGTTLAGATGTVLHISGQKFSASSPITFLLDGVPAPGNQSVNSDANGNIKVDLAITAGWLLGHHTLTARDTSNTTTKSGVEVVIVPQGEAHTPGPFGASPDDTSFRANADIHYNVQAKQLTLQETEVVTGHPDPNGGTVCQAEDDGQPHTYSGVTLDTGSPYQQTATFSCTGTYKGGKLTLTETLLSDTVVFTSSNPSTTCTLNAPHVDEQLSGGYTEQHQFSGTVTFPEIPTSAFPCNRPNSSFFYYGGQGTWTGQIAGS